MRSASSLPVLGRHVGDATDVTGLGCYEVRHVGDLPVFFGVVTRFFLALVCLVEGSTDRFVCCVIKE